MTKGNYVDGFVFAVPRKNIPAYKKMAKEGASVWMKFGALDYKECMGQDVSPSRHGSDMVSFPTLVKMKPTETVWFSYIVFKSRAHRDAVNKKVMAYLEKKYKGAKSMDTPFEMKRMSYGGFKVEISG